MSEDTRSPAVEPSPVSGAEELRWVLPVDIRLARNARPVPLTRIERKDDGSWMLETRTPRGARRRVVLTDEELREVTVVGGPRLVPVEPVAPEPPEAPVEPEAEEVEEVEVWDEPDPYWNDPDRMWADPDWRWADPELLGDTDDSGPDGVEVTGMPRDESASRDRRLVAALGGSLLVVGGLAAGAQAGIEGVRSRNPVVVDDDQSQTIVDPFVGFPGDLDGRALVTRPDLAWEVDAGGLEVRDGGGGAIGTATDLDTDTGLPIAVVRPGVDIETVSATFDAIPDGGGIVFRYQDVDNYWRLVGVPVFNTWSLQRITDGVATTVTDTGLSGGTEVSVTLAGPAIEVSVEGEVRATGEARALATQSAFGITMPVDDEEQVAALEIVAEPS